MAKRLVTLSARDLGLETEEQEPLDVLDLPQLYTKPAAPVLLSVLHDLRSEPTSWEATPRSGTPRSRSGASTPLRPRRKIKSEGVPGYLTKIISSQLTWIDNDEEKERIWETAAQRLSERSGRTGMGAITRSFEIPLSSTAAALIENSSLAASETDDKDLIELTLHEPALTADNLGLKTWASSYLLAKSLALLKKRLPTIPPHAQILELGAGTGLVGMAAAAVFQRHVILTDLPEIVPNLDRNIRSNESVISERNGQVDASVLDWSDPVSFRPRDSDDEHPANSFSLILVADPIYSSSHPALLVNAIRHHLSKEAEARVAIELPLREAFAAERQDLRDQMAGIGLRIVEQGEETGYDDWSSGYGDELTEVRCWWSIWAWKREEQVHSTAWS